MPIEFQIAHRFVGFAASAGSEGEAVGVVYRELVAPADAVHLLDRLERFQGSLFASIPELPPPSSIDHLLVVIRPDLTGIAYVNELNLTATVTTSRSIRAGEPVYHGDITDVESMNLGVAVPEDAAIVFVRSRGWKRSLLFDFGPLLAEPVPRDYPLESALARQELLLLGLASPDGSVLDSWKAGLTQLKKLLADQCEDEARYQELLERHPWMFGGSYDEVRRHANLDDERIPDFIARRTYDQCHDIIEIKQPFLRLFKQRRELAASFNDAWNQAGRYLNFVLRQRAYLLDEKGFRFENPRCHLLLGFELSDERRNAIREKELLTDSIIVWTYDELLRSANLLVNLMEAASQPIAFGATTQQEEA